MKKKIGFIGTGNMSSALIKAAAAAGTIDFYFSNRTKEKAEKLAEIYGGEVCSNVKTAKESELLFLGVKPQMLSEVMNEIRPVLEQRSDRFVLVSMLAGTSIEKLQNFVSVSPKIPVIRIMPNTPVSIGEGILLYTATPDVTQEEKAFFCDIMKNAGLLSEIPEKVMDAASCVSGCGPAFADLFIEALADGAVACGVPRKQALALAAQMLAGSAKLVLQSEKHPGALKDEVCSPGGTTIQGVRALEEGAFRGTVMNAVIAAYEKTLKL